MNDSRKKHVGYKKFPVPKHMWIVYFFSGFVLALFLVTIVDNKHNSQEVHLGGYKFINPLLSCEFGDRISSSHGLRELRSTVSDYLAKEVPTRGIVHVSVYYRDLNNGPWFGINETEKFFPSSLLKVPTLLAVLKKSESTPFFLEKKIQYKEPIAPADQYFKPKESLKVGEMYTVEDLVTRMIRYSDNEALFLLAEILPASDVKKIYNEIGVSLPNITNIDFMNVRNYAAFFRVLFNSSYLNRDSSEKALAILADTDFTTGLVAGVPSGIPVAHKFGEYTRIDTTGGSIDQLHDCGIVYKPTKPYMLCIMTRGSNFSDLEKLIAGVSHVVYENRD